MKFDRRSLTVGALVGGLAMTVATSFGPLVSTGVAQQQPLDQQVADLQTQVSALQSATQKAQVIAVIYELDSAGLHAIDEGIAAGQVPPGALGPVSHVRIAMQAITWPHDLEETGGKEIQQLMLLESALKAQDLGKAADPAHEAHEIGHDLSAQAYAWLGGAAMPAMDDHMH